MLCRYRYFSSNIISLILIMACSAIFGCAMPKLSDYSITEIKMPTPISSSDWKEINISQNRFFISDDFMNKIVYERVGTNGLIAFSVGSRNIFEDPKFEIKLKQIYRKILLPPHNDLRVYSSGKFVSFEESLSRNNYKFFDRAEFFLKGEMGLKMKLSEKKEKEVQLHAMEPFSGPYTPKELKRARDFRNQLLDLVDKRNCKVKVIVYLYKKTIYKFLYINIPSYYEKDLPLFHAFEKSLSKQFLVKVKK